VYPVGRFFVPSGNERTNFGAAQMSTPERTTPRIPAMEAAVFLGVTNQTLGHWRKKGYGPDFYQFGSRYYYAWEDLDKFVEQNAASPAVAAA